MLAMFNDIIQQLSSPLRSRLGVESEGASESCLRGRNLGPSLKDTDRGCRVRESPSVSSSEDKSPTVSAGATICSRKLKLNMIEVKLNCSLKMSKDWKRVGVPKKGL